MRGVLIDRRQFVRAAGAAFVAGLGARAAFALQRTDAVYASGFRWPDGRFGLALMAENGDFIERIDLPGRMHGLCHSPASGAVACFARRPGTFIAVFDARRDHQAAIIAAAAGRHFYGHGQFSPDGRILYASENDFDGGRGVIGLYDATDSYRRLGEFSTFGVGPHDMAVSDDGRTLAIANGGIETHPDFGRTKLNIDRMKPSLALIDSRSGALVEKHVLPERWQQLSTRHLAVGEAGRIWFACQYEGSRNDLPPLAGSFAPGEALVFASLPDDVTAGLGNYVGAIAANRREGLIGLASPKGGLAVTLDAKTGAVVARLPLAGAAGIAPAVHGFAVSSYGGDFAAARQPVAFDQHIVRLAASGR